MDSTKYIIAGEDILTALAPQWFYYIGGSNDWSRDSLLAIVFDTRKEAEDEAAALQKFYNLIIHVYPLPPSLEKVAKDSYNDAWDRAMRGI